MHEFCCAMTKILFVEPKFVKQGSSAQPIRLPSLSRTHSSSPDQSLRLRGGFRCFFSHSSVEIHRLWRSHTPLHSNREGPPSLVPRHQHLRDPRCCRSRPIVLRTRTSFVTRPSRNCRGMYVPPDSPRRSEVLYEACICMPSLQAFVETLRPQVLIPTHLCALPERWFPLSGGHQPFVRLTSFLSTECPLPGALTQRNLPRRRVQRRWARV